jgi:hypothetical protein
MLPLSEVHALVAMMAEDVSGRYLYKQADLVSAVTGLPVEYVEGTCKNVLVLGNQWVIKWSSPSGRISSSDEREESFLATLEEQFPEYSHRFLRAHRVAPNWTIQEYARVNQEWYKEVAEEVEGVAEHVVAGDVFWRNVGRRSDGSWVIFDFDA